MRRSYLQYNVWLVVPLLVIVTANILFLYRTGELTPIDTVVESHMQSKDSCLYGSAIADARNGYKVMMYERVRPRVVTIGSSRAMQFKQSFFREPFFNLGGVMNSIQGGIDQFDRFFRSNMPDVVVVTIDFWWLNNAVIDPNRHDEFASAKEVGIANSLFLPTVWMIKGSLRVQDYLSMLVTTRDNGCNFGVSAILEKTAFSQDGSYHYTQQVTGNLKNDPAVGLANTREDVAIGDEKYRFAERVSDEHMHALVSLVNMFKERNIALVLVLPPMASEIVDLMEASGKFGIVDDLQERLSQIEGITFIDAHDPRNVDSTTCEFTDGAHGGEITYARITKLIHDATTNERVREAIHVDNIERYIRDYAGLAMIPDERVTTEPEVDFLQIGCKKNAVE